MPLHLYRCSVCGQVTETYSRRASLPPAPVLDCPACGSPAPRDVRLSCRPARTPGRWGESTARYDRGLGTMVRDSMHRERIMKARGLVCEGDLASGVAEQAIHREIVEHQEHERLMSRAREIQKSQGTTKGEALGLAVAETTPLEE